MIYACVVDNPGILAKLVHIIFPTVADSNLSGLLAEFLLIESQEKLSYFVVLLP